MSVGSADENKDGRSTDGYVIVRSSSYLSTEFHKSFECPESIKSDGGPPMGSGQGAQQSDSPPTSLAQYGQEDL